MKYSLYNVSERSSNRLILNRNRNRFLFQTVFLILFLIGWLAGLLQVGGSDKNFTERVVNLLYNPFYWVFLFAAFWIAYEIIKNIFLLINGDRILIDKSEMTIAKNNHQAVKFSELECLQIRQYTDSDNDTDYRLSIAKTNGAKIFIDRSSDKDGIMEFAEEISDFIGKPIKFK